MKILMIATLLVLTSTPALAMSPTKYPVVCTDEATAKVTLVADGSKVRVAYWKGDQPRFTDSKRSSVHKRVFAAPTGSVCRINTR